MEKSEVRLPTIQHLQDGLLSINYDALEERFWTTKELVDLIIEARGLDSAPITREFIEGFGFEYEQEHILGGEFYNKMSDAYRIELYVLEGRYSLNTFLGNDRISSAFSDMVCTTQSELRFLLTRGRIDCSNTNQDK